jgi:predicted phage-related endonuclease
MYYGNMMIDRKDYVGSTEIVALVEPDESPFTSAYAMWLEKTGLIERDDSPTERMKTGKYLERAILDEWNMRNKRSFVFNTSPIYIGDGIAATPDGMDTFSSEGAEVKTVTSHRRSDWDNGTPRYIWWQCQHEMLCTGFKRIAVIAQFGFDSLEHEWIVSDRDAHARILGACAEFWKRVRGELPPPEVDGHEATTDALKRRKLDAKVIEFGADIREWAQILALQKAKEKEAKSIAKTMENKIRAALGDATTGVWPDGTGFRILTKNVKEYMVKARTQTELKRIANKDAVEDQDE